MGDFLLQMAGMLKCEVILTAETVATTTEESGGQFPFLAALILVAIIVVVSIGDMVSVNKSKEEPREISNEEQESNTKM